MELLSGCLKKIKSLHLLLTKYPQDRFLNEKRVGTNQLVQTSWYQSWYKSILVQPRFLNEKRVGTNQIVKDTIFLCKMGEWVTNYTLLYLYVYTLQNS